MSIWVMEEHVFVGLIFGRCGAVVLGKCEKLEEGRIVTGEMKGREAPKVNLVYTSPFFKREKRIDSVSLPHLAPAPPRQRIQGITLF